VLSVQCPATQPGSVLVALLPVLLWSGGHHHMKMNKTRRGQQQHYSPLPVDAEEEHDDQHPPPPPQLPAVAEPSRHKLSGHNAAGEAHSHWSGLSPEEARSFPGCPSDRIVFPEYSASFLRWVSYQWLTPLMKLGNRCHLQDSDVWAIHPKESCTTNGPQMRGQWQREQRAAAAAGRDASITWAVFYTTRRRMGIAGCWKLLADSFKLCNPFILRQILLVVEGSDEAVVSATHAWVLAIVLFFATWAQVRIRIL
jgi:hypothetical protein